MIGRYINILLFSFFLLGCVEQSKKNINNPKDLIESDTSNSPNRQSPFELNSDKISLKSHFIHGKIRYSAALLSSKSFLNRKGTTLPQDEIDKLSDEYVLILDLKSLSKKTKSPFDLAQCQLPKNEAIKRFSFHYEENIYLESNDQKIFPNGSQFERDFGLSDRIRLVCFFTIDTLKSNYVLHLNDRLFGAGKRKIRIKEPELI